MLFNSFQYLIFLPLVLLLYFCVKPRFRWVLLLVASYYFYMSWKAEYALLILFCTVVNYVAGIYISKTESRGKRKAALSIALVISFGVLFVYKYLGFFTDSFNRVLQVFNKQAGIPVFELLLPVGISFFTFQTLSYTIDVYRGTVPVERHFGIFALYVSFFPQLVAGPIERSDNLLPQLRKVSRFDLARIIEGLKLILWGLFKKMVVADRLSPLVNVVYNDVQAHDGYAFVFATVAFAFQIFCDFSGYSDIAVGSAKLMGIELMENFRRPYFSKSTGEFWRRWHISLSSWFRDYLYIPLGGSRKGTGRYMFHNMLTFAVSGLWHGANWTFIIWGLLNGVYTTGGKLLQGAKSRVAAFFKLDKVPALHRVLQIAITFCLICFSWIFFRANSLADAGYILRHMLPDEVSLAAAKGSLLHVGSRYELGTAVFFVLVMEMVHYVQRCETKTKRFFRRHVTVRFASYLFLFASILMFGVTGNETEFIYFQF